MIKDTSGPGGNDEGRATRIEDLRREASIMVFKNALAHRLAERIMTQGLMTSVYDWYEDLHRIMEITSQVDGLLRSVKRYGTYDEQGGGAEPQEPSSEVGVGTDPDRGRHGRRG